MKVMGEYKKALPLFYKRALWGNSRKEVGTETSHYDGNRKVIINWLLSKDK